MGTFSRLIVFVASALILNSCSLFDEGDMPPGNDGIPVEKIDFNVEKSSGTTEWIYCEPIELDLSKYDRIDSIIFMPNLRSQTVEKKCIAQLYDYTHDSPINNSLVTSIVRYTLHFVRSDNLIHSFNKDPSSIGIRFRSSQEGHYVEVGVESQLLIYYR